MPSETGDGTGAPPALFLYGTLMHGPLFDLIAGPGVGTSTGARLSGFAVIAAEDGLPMLCRAAGGVVDGRIWSGLDPARLARIDKYEVPFGYDRRTVTVDTDAGPVAAQAYFPPATAALTDAAWDIDVWFSNDGAATLHTARELTSHHPELTGDQMVRQWPMMRTRAEAKVRAERTPAPATRRRTAGAGDVTLTQRTPLQGAFFKFAHVGVDHRRFDGTRAEGLDREVLVGFDAAIILPFDAARDRVLLVEQVRMGAALRGDPNPWILEPVAGIIDAGETPEDAARREGKEEAGLSFDTVERMFSAYPSPGSTSDHFHCFVGHTDLPDDLPRRGGLASEAEDLALHLLTLDEALDLVTSGEINAMPLIAMLYWLVAHRPPRDAAPTSA